MVSYSRGFHWQDLAKLRHILLLGFVLRLAWALLVEVHPVSDGFVYDQLAQRIAEGHGYSWPNGDVTAYWPVGTSALYAGLYALAGHDLRVAAAANVVMGTLLIAATYALARTQFERGPALLAAALVAVWPTWIAFTTIISSELPSTLLFTGALAVAFSNRGPDWARTLVSSVMLALSAYVRANLLPFVLIVPALIALARRSPRYLIVHGALAAAVAAAAIAPWTIRNQREFGEPVTVSTNLGVNLWIGNNPQAYGGYMDPPPIGVDPMPANEAEQDKLYRARAMEFIRENPGRYAMLSLARAVQTFDREVYGVAWNEQGLSERAKLPLKLAMSAYWLAILAASLVGLSLFLKGRPGRLLSPFVLIPAALVAPSILVMAAERFHYGLAPFIAAFAAYAIVRLGAWARRGQRTDAPGNGVPNGGS